MSPLMDIATHLSSQFLLFRTTVMCVDGVTGAVVGNDTVIVTGGLTIIL